MKKKLNEKRAINEYGKGIDSLIRMFLIKQGYEEDGEPYSYDFIGKDKDIINVCDFILNVSDIYYDMEQRVEKGTIFDWYEYNLDMSLLGYGFVSYQSYLMGFRHKRSKIKELIHEIKDRLYYAWFCIRYYRINKESKKILNKKINKFIDENEK